MCIFDVAQRQRPVAISPQHSPQGYTIFNGALITKNAIRNINQDTFKVSLGIVNTVKVVRNKIKGDTEKAIIGSKEKYSFAFELVAQNYNNFPVQVQILDQVPVPTDKIVVVEVQQISNEKLKVYPNMQSSNALQQIKYLLKKEEWLTGKSSS